MIAEIAELVGTLAAAALASVVGYALLPLTSVFGHAIVRLAGGEVEGGLLAHRPAPDGEQ